MTETQKHYLRGVEVKNEWIDDALSVFDGRPIKRVMAECIDGTFWMVELRGYEPKVRDWEQYFPPMMTDEPLNIPPPYIPSPE